MALRLKHYAGMLARVREARKRREAARAFPAAHYTNAASCGVPDDDAWEMQPFPPPALLAAALAFVALRRELAAALFTCTVVWLLLRSSPQCFHMKHCRALATLACATCLACTDGVLVATAMVLTLSLVPRG